MNSVSENTTQVQSIHNSVQDDYDFLEEFARTELANTSTEQAVTPADKCFDNEGYPVYENITAKDIKDNRHIYEYARVCEDDFELVEYTTKVREIAKGFMLTRLFDTKIKPYADEARKRFKAEEKDKRRAEFLKMCESFPEWWDGQTIDEDVFCKCFLEKREVKCINGLLYDINGLIDEKAVENEIYSQIKYYCKKDIALRARRILEALKTRCFSPPLDTDTETIHLQNGTLKTNGTFTSEKQFCTCRLNVQYPAEYKEPKMWLRFLDDLLEPLDILTLQEYLGYCLIPSTKAQKMLMIIGKGGEGKSRIGIVMQHIFGFGGLVSGQIQDFDNSSKSRFARAKLVSRLVFLDDDLDLSGLAKTSFLKQLVTAEIPLEVEDKHKSSIQTWLYSRVLAFGNGAITSLYDKSDGFYRRQIILTTKDKPQGRKDDKYLVEKLATEKDNIFMWCFEGLQRLIANNYEFTISDKAKQNLDESRREGFNILDFMESKYDFCFDSTAECHTKELYWAYESWCSLNGLETLRLRTFANYLKSNSQKYNIEYTEHARNGRGARARGFKGIRYLKEYATTYDIQ